MGLVLPSLAQADNMLIYMDLAQTDHLKAYGMAYWALERGHRVEWLLNYRGGSFLLDASPEVATEARIRGVAFAIIPGSQVAQIYQQIQDSNMEVVTLEKAPAIAVYTPPGKQPWDDAVTLALTYAEIPYKTLWDEEVVTGELDQYDWLHLHHEDFTGQYSKFYVYRNQPWYRRQQLEFETMAHRLGFSTVAEEKKAVARIMKDYVARGGFLFAMCSATDTFEIALAAEGVDIVPPEYDRTPQDPNAQAKLDFTKTLAFENFTLELRADMGSFSNIDVNQVNTPRRKPVSYFTLFEFSAKYDPVPSMLTQNHVNHIEGFYGLLSTYNRAVIKKSVVILAEEKGTGNVRYLHGNYGRGTFTFYGGHDPEDKEHVIGDPPTQLSLHKNSPGYRLILNNVLFPAAKKKEHKT